MNREKMTLAVIGGVFAVALLAAGYFAFSAYSAKVAAIEGDDDTTGLESVVSKARQLTGKPVYPCEASERAVSSNVSALVEWKESALKAASRGDRVFEKTTAAAFKTMVVADAKRLAMLPGGTEGHIVKPEFGFGPFKDYITGGKMPEDAQLATLQRQWDDVATLVEALSKCGVIEVTAIDLKVEEAKPEQEAAAKGAKGKPKKKAKAKKNAPEKAKAAVAHAYVVQFSAKPDAFVRAVNAFATSERFAVVEDFGFTRTADAIAQALGGETKKAEAATAGSRRSRRRGGAAAAAAAAAAKEKKEKSAAEGESKKSGVITDPSVDAPLAVTMKISVCDFGTLEESEEKAKGDEKVKVKGEGEGKAKAKGEEKVTGEGKKTDGETRGTKEAKK